MILVFGLLHPFHFGRLILLALLTMKRYIGLVYYTGLLCVNNSVNEETYLDVFAGEKKEILCVLPKKQKHSQGKLKLCHIAEGKLLSDNFTRQFAEDCTLLISSWLNPS